MKKLLLLIVIMLTMVSCENKKPITKTTKIGGYIEEEDGIFIHQTQLKEFDYKGHTYVSCHVRDGKSITHAGHCKCNSK
jgi:hypothetical protein